VSAAEVLLFTGRSPPPCRRISGEYFAAISGSVDDISFDEKYIN
jgi:hypothetical protein